MKPGVPLPSPIGNRVVVTGETLGLPLLMVGLGLFLNPGDPLWTDGPFPWAWLAPTVLALRYGSFPGLGAAVVLLAAWAGLTALGWIAGPFPKLNFLGGLILVMLASEFSSLWWARIRRAEGARIYLEQRLEYLTHQYYVLRLSHDCLEQDLIGRPLALRDALLALRELTGQPGPSRLPGADALLRLLAEYCQLEVAALHACHNGHWDPVPAASLGPVEGRFDPADPLVRLALEKGTLAHLAQGADADGNSSRYQVAVPLRTFDGRCIGLLAVERMSFFALHDEMLQSLNLLLRYYGDGLAMHGVVGALRRQLPDCPTDFAFELQRLWHVRRESGVKSVLVALEFRAPREFDDLVLEISQHKRSVDMSWVVDGQGGSKLLVILMPLAGPAAAQGYLAAIADWVQQKTDCSLAEAGIFSHVLPLDEAPPLALLQRLFSYCHVDVHTSPRPSGVPAPHPGLGACSG